MLNRTPYILSQSALYKVTTRRRLAEVLLVDRADLENLATRGQENYRQYKQRPKPGKTPRWIETPTPELKRVQRRIHDLLARIAPPDFMFSGFPRRSAVQNAKRHSAADRMVKLDIASFYPSSDGRRVFTFFVEDMLCTDDVAGILTDLTTISVTTASDHAHLPTGGVTSPILAYYAYRSMFDELLQLATDRNVQMTVIMDDITFSGSGADHTLLSAARQVVRRHNLESKRKKERVWGAARTKTVTGVVLTTQGARLPNSRRARIHGLQQELRETQDPLQRAKLYQRLGGALFSAAQIEEQFLQQGKAVYQLWRKDDPAWLLRGIVSKKP